MLNLLPRRKNNSLLLARNQAVGFMAACLMTFAIFFCFRFLLENKNKRVLSEVSELNHKIEIQRLINQQKNRMLTLEKQKCEKQIALNQQKKLISTVKLLADLLPDNSYLSTLQYHAKQLSFEGILLSSNTVLLDRLLINLVRTGSLIIRSKTIELLEDKKIVFKISVFV